MPPKTMKTMKAMKTMKTKKAKKAKTMKATTTTTKKPKTTKATTQKAKKAKQYKDPKWEMTKFDWGILLPPIPNQIRKMSNSWDKFKDIVEGGVWRKKYDYKPMKQKLKTNK